MEGPHNKDYSILGSILYWVLLFWESALWPAPKLKGSQGVELGVDGESSSLGLEAVIGLQVWVEGVRA